VRITTVFLDDGGVLNDNERRAAEWQRLVGEFLAPRLGGTPKAWGDANSAVFDQQWRRFEEWQRRAIERDEHGDFFGSAEERQRWLREMCAHVGVVAPQGAGCVELARQTEEYVIPRVRAAFPGAVDAVRALSSLGYTLSTASGAPSKDLERFLTGMGVRDLFAGRLHGPDLVRALKGGRSFYERIFADSSVSPDEALVVDDAPEALRHAAQAGARTVLVTTRGPDVGGPWVAIASLAELPALVERL
jgi:HAD superfamily hydrolase (TIGR01509 family)